MGERIYIKNRGKAISSTGYKKKRERIDCNGHPVTQKGKINLKLMTLFMTDFFT
jgi:hypothetical protein